MTKSKSCQNLAAGLAFLAPNIFGFLAFTFIPLIFSLVLAFSNADLREHNRFRQEPLRFVWFENFARLFTQIDFWRYFGNTLFMMLSIPFGIAASLWAAMMLHREIGTRQRSLVLGAAAIVCAAVLLALLICGASGGALLLGIVTCGILLLGAIGGMSVYRTLFYIPSFTAGVAIYILWTKLYNPQTGPINAALKPALAQLTGWVQQSPSWAVQAAMWCLLAGMLALLWITAARLRRMWADSDLGTTSIVFLLPILAFPAAMALLSMSSRVAAILTAAAVVCIISWQVGKAAKERHHVSRALSGVGSGMMLAMGSVVGQLVLLGLAVLVSHLPEMASDGLAPPAWLSNYHFAKPAIMIVGLWAAIGSNNMLLYLAALSNIPEDLYEAAELDGAGRIAKFWNVTWPQLAPTTFFIVVISVIGGLQGGFDSARAMTAGGPAGSTTTLSYYIYSEGFLGGHMGYASSISWVMFLIILVVTLFNWKFGSQYVND